MVCAMASRIVGAAALISPKPKAWEARGVSYRDAGRTEAAHGGERIELAVLVRVGSGLFERRIEVVSLRLKGLRITTRVSEPTQQLKEGRAQGRRSCRR